ncbi:hypothetical protein QFW77_00560 [Luteimonas sp. RD2P54]|uniref:Transmembrane repetitive protein n=1 Tax=Luteimonas endophytica TaxID=3042023 RepID=A0ABT6J3T8_9GAMM|nr:hypothetical protein [Luteimonas endophytica]MDH5821487.1 hypothetical protein [Luteimonas endophytica]
MFTSAELIEALRRRLRRSIRPPQPGQFPPGWQAWFDGMRGRAGAVTGASAAAIVAVMLGRAPPVPVAWVQLNRWQAFGALWRQQWHPASEDERWMRVSATTLSLVLHLLFSALLLWLMYARFLQVAAPSQRGEDTVIEVEYIGDGTPEAAGAGAPQRTAQDAAQAAPAAAAPELPQAARQAVPPPSAPREAQPEPEPAPQPREQPLQVTETPRPDTRFVVPPPRPVELAQPRVEMPEVPVRSRDIEVVEIREPPLPQVRPLPEAVVEVPELQQPEVALVEREIAAPLPQPRTAPVQVPAIAAPELQATAPAVRTREIPLRLPASARAGERTERTADSGAAIVPGEAAAPAAAPEAAAAGGARPDALATGSGEPETPDPGAWETPRRGDDWGDSARQRVGGQQGSSSLFNADGSPRLAEGTAPVGGGLPPGTITEDYEKIDRMGTWLKRPPGDYEPTSFDRFWVPHETLLEEWVRRSVRTVLIPIPGTGKTIRCDVVTLALAGGCSISDPNMQDVEAEARPPPDVPFKRELFEDQDSLGD